MTTLSYLVEAVRGDARAAGPGGRVEFTVGMLAEPPPRAALEVQDNGPGFGNGPPGATSLGLGVVTPPLESRGGSIELEAPAGRDALLRLVIPAERGPAAAPDRSPVSQVST